MTATFRRPLLDRATHLYRSAGSFARRFKGKLKGGPAFFGLLEHGLIPDAARLGNLDCSQGLLASWPLGARAPHEAGDWPAQWPAAPKVKHIWGQELMPKDADARAAPSPGSLITRIGDAVGGVPFHFSNRLDRAVSFLHGHAVIPLCRRTTAGWLDVLKRCGLEARSVPMHEGIAFKNVTLITKAV